MPVAPSHSPPAAAIDINECFTRFAARAAATQMTADLVRSKHELIRSVQSCLELESSSPRIVLDDTLAFVAADLSDAGIGWVSGETQSDGDVYLAAGQAVIADCGAVVLVSGPGRLLRNDFLARTHIVVVNVDQLLPSLRDFWPVLRGQIASGQLQREYCLVTGPSRTADLGVPAKLGAHGPARVHAIIYAA